MTEDKLSPNEPLKALRKFTGMSQRDFAVPLGMTGPRIAHLERGAEPVGRMTALRLIDTYRKPMKRSKITIEELMRGYFVDFKKV